MWRSQGWWEILTVYFGHRARETDEPRVWTSFTRGILSRSVECSNLSDPNWLVCQSWWPMGTPQNIQILSSAAMLDHPPHNGLWFHLLGRSFHFVLNLQVYSHTSVLSEWTDIFVCVRHDNQQSQRLRFLRMSHHVDLSSNKCVEGRSYKRRTDGITLSRGPGGV